VVFTRLFLRLGKFDSRTAFCEFLVGCLCTMCPFWTRGGVGFTEANQQPLNPDEGCCCLSLGCGSSELSESKPVGHCRRQSSWQAELRSCLVMDALTVPPND
jgi:hypothetical protein